MGMVLVTNRPMSLILRPDALSFDAAIVDGRFVAVRTPERTVCARFDVRLAPFIALDVAVVVRGVRVQTRLAAMTVV